MDDGASLGEFVERINSTLYRLTPDDSFAAVFVATYDADSGVLTYVNCGHNPEPWCIPAGDGAPLRTLSEGGTTLLGFQEQIPVAVAECRPARGDTFVLVTDGIVEARGADGSFFTKPRLEGFLQAQRGDNADDLAEGIVRQVREFTGDSPQADDQTVLVMRIK